MKNFLFALLAAACTLSANAQDKGYITGSLESNDYVEGSITNDASCFEMMYEMLSCNEIELGKTNKEDAMDLCAINGARLHDKKLLAAAVESYKRGRLTQFAREMEMYHLPAYEAIPDDEPLDEEEYGPDDDGRYDAWA